MSPEAVRYAATQIRERIDPHRQIDARQEASGDTVHHFLWMCDQLIERKVTGNKAHRWLGYLQCAMIFSGEEHLDLSSMKELSREANEKFPDEGWDKLKHHEFERRFGVIIGAEYVYPAAEEANLERSA